MTKQLKKSLSFATVNLLMLIVVSACVKNPFEEDPMSLYDKNKDVLALRYAMKGLGGEHDFFDRLFVVQYHLARYLESGERTHAEKITANYKGVNFLQKLPISNPVFEEYLWLAKYYDAAILAYVDSDENAALNLLDSYCPVSDYIVKMSCHIDNFDYFESNARSGFSRYSLEASFIVNLTIGDVYDDARFLGNALWLLAQYDVAEAEMRAKAYATRNQWNDRVMHSYCEAVSEYLKWPDVLGYTAYVTAFENSNCRIYVAQLDSSGQSATESRF